MRDAAEVLVAHTICTLYEYARYSTKACIAGACTFDYSVYCINILVHVQCDIMCLLYVVGPHEDYHWHQIASAVYTLLHNRMVK
jgi:hypothetical protein